MEDIDRERLWGTLVAQRKLLLDLYLVVMQTIDDGFDIACQLAESQPDTVETETPKHIGALSAEEQFRVSQHATHFLEAFWDHVHQVLPIPFELPPKPPSTDPA